MRLPTIQTSKNTLVIVTQGWLARADFVGRWRPKLRSIKTSTWNASTDTDHILLDGIEQALQLDSTPVANLSIISPLIWTGVVTVPVDIVQITSSSELNQALAIEAECETGVSAFTSKIALVQVESTKKSSASFCVSQLHEDLLEQIKHLAKSNGAKLVSLAHPASIRLPQSEQGTELGQIRSLSELIQNQLSTWQQSEVQRLDDTEIQQLAQRLSTAWSSPKNRVRPLQILSDSHQLKLPTPAISLTLAALAAGLCWGWNQKLDLLISETRTKLRQTDQQQNEASEIESSAKKLDTKLVQLRKELSEAQKAQQASEIRAQLVLRRQARRNERWSQLLNSLAKTNSDCWVQRITTESDQTLVHGIAISQSAAQKFAVELELNLAGSGWHISPAITTPVNSDLFSFLVSLSPDDSLPIDTQNQHQVVKAQQAAELTVEENRLAFKELLP